MIKSFRFSLLSVLSAGFSLAVLVGSGSLAAADDEEGFFRGLYVQGEAGIAIVPNQTGHLFQPAGNVPLTLDHDEALSYGGQLGIIIPEGFRIEAEGIMHKADRSGFGPAGTETDILLLMANLLYDMDVGEFPIRPYWGGGVGASLIDFNVPLVAGGSFDDDTTNFAWQLTTGARAHVIKGLFVDVNYTYSRVLSPTTSISNTLLGGNIGLDFQRIGLHGVRGGLGIEF